MILLIHPKTGTLERAGYRLPLGLLYLATYLKRYDLEASILDIRVNNHWKKEIYDKLKNVDFVGITCFIGPMIEDSIKIAQLVKNIKPNVKVILGGVHPSLVPEQALEIPEIDMVVRGEGEEPLREILQGNKLSGIFGLSYRDENGKIVHNPSAKPLPVEKISVPDYSLLDMSKYSATTYSNEKSMSIMSSRGCPYMCSFCYLSKDGSWRPFLLDVVINNAIILIEQYKIKTLYFEDDNVAADPERFFNILRKLKKYKVNLAFQGVRIDTLYRFSDEMIREMQECGVKSMDVGVETTSNRLLDFIDKKQTKEMIFDVVDKLKKYNFNVKFNFIAGIPGKTEEEEERDLEIIKKLNKEHSNSFVLFNIYMPFPGASLHEEAVRAGFKPPENFLGWAVFTGTKWMRKHSWMSISKQERLEALHFLFILGNKNILTKVSNKFIRILVRIYYPIAQFRISNEFYGFFIEKKIAELLKINI